MPSCKPKCIPVPFTRCLHEKEENELSGCPSTGNTVQKSGVLLAKLCPPVCGGTEVLGGAFPTQMVMHNDPSTSGTGNSPESENLLKKGLIKQFGVFLPSPSHPKPSALASSAEPWVSRTGGGCRTRVSSASSLCTFTWLGIHQQNLHLVPWPELLAVPPSELQHTSCNNACGKSFKLASVT